MEDPAPVAPVPQKRPLEDEVEPPVTPIKPTTDSQASTPLSVLSVETPSPLKSSAQTSTGPGSNKSADGQAPSPQNASTSTSTQQPAKRRKFTSQEKEAQRLEKEAKAKAREEKKAQKETEDRLKAEQKAQKDEEKRKKNEERDEKKRLKEEEQQRLEEERAKKARVSLPSRFEMLHILGMSCHHFITVYSLPSTANSTTVADEAECFLREAKVRFQPKSDRGSFIPDPHCSHIITRQVWRQY